VTNTMKIAAMFLIVATACCANVVLQFVPEGVECCWVGDTSTSQLDPVPLPQGREKFTARYHELEHPYVIDSPGRPIEVWYKVGAVETLLTEGVDYDITYNPLSFDMVNGYTCASVTGEPGYNCELDMYYECKTEKTYFVEYHFVNPPRGKSEVGGNITFSYCPTSTVIQGFMQEHIEKTVEELQPRYINFGHDEPWQMHTCERCREVEHPGEITAPGQLFADSVNDLVGYYEDACIVEYGSTAFEQGQKDGYYRSIIFADHVSYPHEHLKVNGYGGNDWWYYRGTETANWVSTSKQEIDKSVIMWDWNYIYEDNMPTDTTNKYKYIEDLTGAGFDVLGGNAGYSNSCKASGGGVDPWGGAAVYARLEYINWQSEPADFDVHLSSFEGTMEQYLPLYKYTKSHPVYGHYPHYKQDENGRWWFKRDIRGGEGGMEARKKIEKWKIEEGGKINDDIFKVE